MSWNSELLETLPIAWPEEKMTAFCDRWKVEGLWLFGSVLRDDFGPDSDVDFLVRFLPNDPWDLLDLVRMQRELAEIIGRPVDLIERGPIERSRNPLRRKEILSTSRRIYGVKAAV
ncbi:MAG: nucleotidyltransferase family protein [Cyanobacteria bacterium P01_C01_bin.89]